MPCALVCIKIIIVCDFVDIRPDQFNLVLLGYCEAKIGPSDREKKKRKAINWDVVIDHNLIKTG